MTDDNVKKAKKFGIVSIMTIMLITLVSVCGAFYIYTLAHQQTLKDLETNIEANKSLNNVNIELVQKINNVTAELELVKNSPTDVTGDALLERDIFIYIDQKFQLIPKTATKEIAKQIVMKARSARVSPELVVGIIQVESAFNASAVSKANARGLMQVMPEWAPKFGLKKVSDLHDIDTGIQSGIKVLKIHIKEEGDNLTKGLFKYVGGSDAYAGKVYAAMGQFVAYRTSISNHEEEKDNSYTTEQ